MAGVVTFETKENGRLVLVRLNRPKANILDAEMIDAITKGLASIVTPQVCSIIMSHEGPNFSFGASVEEHRPEQVNSMIHTFHGLFRFLHGLNLPILAAVKGGCLGGGMELASFCHFLFTTPDAKFGQPEINLAVFPPMASLILNVKNPMLSDDLNLTGRTITGEELHLKGLVTYLCDDPEAKALEFARNHLVKKSAKVLRLATKASRWRYEELFENLLPTLEHDYLVDLMSTHDAKEGIASFLEKRKPEFKDG